MADKKVNPAAVLSRELIMESLFDMLSVKPLSSISISEISENAKVDRRTFYRHFKTKKDVIKYYIHEVAKQYEEILLKNNTIDGHSILKTIFEVCLIMKETLHVLYKQNLLDLFLAEFEVIYEKHQYRFSKPEILKMENVAFMSAFEIGGMTNMVKKWITDGCRISPENMTVLLKQMFLLYKENI